MASTKKVEAVVGQPVQIILQSMASSTGYSWYLQSLDGGMALSKAYASPAGTGIAPINQFFEFLATAEGTFKVTFGLIAPWRPGDPADTEVFEVEVRAPKATAAEDIAAAMKGSDFVSASAVNVGADTSSSTVLKYAAPMATAADPCASCATPQTGLLYAAPMAWTNQAPAVIYAAPMSRAVAGPQVIYAAPMSQANAAGPLLYAAPMSMQPLCAAPMSQASAVGPLAYAAPMSMQPLYAAPMPQASAIGPLAYAAPMSMQPLCAGPMSQANAAGPLLYAAPMNMAAQPIILYAAPIAQAAGIAAAMMQPYAAPYTPGRCC